MNISIIPWNFPISFGNPLLPSFPEPFLSNPHLTTDMLSVTMDYFAFDKVLYK
jgi:hypothetical protein